MDTKTKLIEILNDLKSPFDKSVSDRIYQIELEVSQSESEEVKEIYQTLLNKREVVW